MPLKTGDPFSLNTVQLPRVSSTGLQSQMFWGFIFQVKNSQVGSPLWSSDPSLLGGAFEIAITLPFVGHPPGRKDLEYTACLHHLFVAPSLYRLL